jgi:hypothetical protein
MDVNFYRYVNNRPVDESDPSGCGYIDCVAAVDELQRAVAELLRRQAENKCPDRGHNKSIEQARNRVKKALSKAKHCLSDQDIREIEIVLGAAAFVVIAPELIPFLPELAPTVPAALGAIP